MRIYLYRTIVPNFTPIRFETTDPQAFFEEDAPTPTIQFSLVQEQQQEQDE